MASPLIVGLTVVAFGTSTPELAVSLKAALAGTGDISVGNIVGSNIFNAGMILGLASMVAPLSVHLQVLHREIPIMLAVTVIFPLLLMGGGLMRMEAAVLLVGILLYVGFSVRLAKRENIQVETSVPGTPTLRLQLAIALLVVGIGPMSMS